MTDMRNHSAAARAVKALMHQIRRNQLGLENVRTKAFEELRSLNLERLGVDESWKTNVWKARSKEELFEAVEQLEASISAQANQPSTVSGLLARIAVQDPNPSRPKGYYIVIPYQLRALEDEILYYFSPSTISSTQLLIDAPWCKDFTPLSTRIHVRTSQRRPVATNFRSLVALFTRLDHQKFFFIHRSIIANYEAITELNLTEKSKQAGIVAERAVERLTISQNQVPAVRLRFGISRANRN
jgi:hypothetical protein